MSKLLTRRQFIHFATTVTTGVAVVACTPTTTAQPGGSETGAVDAETITLQPVLRTNVQEQEFQEIMFGSFEAEHPNIQISPVYVPGAELDQKTDLMIAAGTPPDLWFPGAARGNRYYADKGLLLVLDPYMERDEFDLNDFYERSLALCQWNGEYSAIPIDQNTQFMCYNKTLFDEAGVAYPPTSLDDASWTWAEFLEVSQALTKQEGNTISQYGTSTGFDTDRFAAWIYGGEWFDEESNQTGYAQQFLWHRDQVEAGLQYSADLMNVHRVQPNPEEAQAFGAGIPLHLTGQIALWSAQTSSLAGFSEITTFDWGICAVPQPPELPRRLKVFVGQWMAFKDVAHPDEAWLLLQHMTSPEQMKVFPISMGRLPARKSLESTWWESLLEVHPHLTEDELATISGSADIGYPTTSYTLIHFGEYWGRALKPELDKLWLGQLTAAEAIANMIPVMKDMEPNIRVEGEV